MGCDLHGARIGQGLGRKEVGEEGVRGMGVKRGGGNVDGRGV